MDKNWLIRTKNFQILGPVSKDKIKSFIDQKKLSPDDEIGSGNGYWFYISEDDLLSKYLFGDVPQGFNTVSEAESVVSVKKDGQTASMANLSPQLAKEGAPQGTISDIVVPVEDDLAYPDMDEIATPSDEDLDYPNMDEIITPSNEDLEYPDMPSEAGSSMAAGPIEVPEMSPVEEEHSYESAPTPGPSREEAYTEEDLSDGKLPDDSDLEFPDMEQIGKSIEKEIASFEDPGAFEEDTQEVNVVPIDKKTSMESRATLSGTSENELKVKEKLKNQIKARPRRLKRKKAPPKVERDMQSKKLRRGRNDSYLFILLIVFILFVVGIFFFYKKSFPSFSSLLMNDAVAQDSSELTKKKAFQLHK